MHEQVYNHYNIMFMTFNIDIIRVNCECTACDFHCHHVTGGIDDYVQDSLQDNLQELVNSLVHWL